MKRVMKIGIRPRRTSRGIRRRRGEMVSGEGSEVAATTAQAVGR